MLNLFQPYDLIVIVFSAAIMMCVLILFGYLMGRKTITDRPIMHIGRKQVFDPGPGDPEEFSELNDAYNAPGEADLS